MKTMETIRKKRKPLGIIVGVVHEPRRQVKPIVLSPHPTVYQIPGISFFVLDW
jgi:hypothetical protein